MRDLTKEQAASGRRLHAFTLAILSVAGITTGMTMAVQAADLSVSPVQLAEADRTAQQGIPVADLSPNAPSQYTVRSGDTLWGISGQYLRQPWRWPQLWGMNRQQVHNPHLIYPGQILYLVQRDGRAYLSTNPPGGASGDVRLSPRIRGNGGDGEAIQSIASSDIEPFLIRPLVVDQGTVDTSARIVALPDARVYMGRGDMAYARHCAGRRLARQRLAGIPAGQPVLDPVTGRDRLRGGLRRQRARDARTRGPQRGDHGPGHPVPAGNRSGIAAAAAAAARTDPLCAACSRW
jgi:LysM repeat protein